MRCRAGLPVDRRGTRAPDSLAHARLELRVAVAGTVIPGALRSFAMSFVLMYPGTALVTQPAQVLFGILPGHPTLVSPVVVASIAMV